MTLIRSRIEAFTRNLGWLLNVQRAEIGLSEIKIQLGVDRISQDPKEEFISLSFPFSLFREINEFLLEVPFAPSKEVLHAVDDFPHLVFIEVWIYLLLSSLFDSLHLIFISSSSKIQISFRLNLDGA